MNKSIIKKLYSNVEQVELAEVKVELANINDFNKLVDSADKLYKQFNDSYADLEKIKPQIIAYGNQFLSVMEKISMANIDLKKQFSELGLDWSTYPESKKLRDIVSKSGPIGSMVQRVKQL